VAKTGLCIGINDYPGTQNDLSGCVNDAQDWAGTLEGRGFTVRALLNAEATRANMMQAMLKLISAAKSGDSVIITYSGHGTSLPDTSGDERDGYDEGLCPYDIGQGNVLLDDEIHKIFAQRGPGVRVVLISDSCHSGSVTRAAVPDRNAVGPRARFLPPAVWLAADRPVKKTTGKIPPRVAGWPTSRGIAGGLSSTAGDLLLAGCRDSEFSYDADFGGRPCGAFSYYALKTLKALSPTGTYTDWYKAMRDYLPGSNYPQTPQIFGVKRARQLKVFT
jgi:hypothetical protein